VVEVSSDVAGLVEDCMATLEPFTHGGGEHTLPVQVQADFTQAIDEQRRSRPLQWNRNDDSQPDRSAFMAN